VSQVVNNYLYYFGAETFNYAPQQVMRHGTRRLDALQSPVDSEDLNDAYDDREAARPVALFQDDYLLVRRFVDDYPRQFDFNIHFGTTSSRFTIVPGRRHT
jgi:hypothetical protein